MMYCVNEQKNLVNNSSFCSSHKNTVVSLRIAFHLSSQLQQIQTVVLPLYHTGAMAQLGLHRISYKSILAFISGDNSIEYAACEQIRERKLML